MRPRRVEHVAIAVRDLDESKRALEEVLGLELSHEEEHEGYGVRMAMYAVGGTALELMEGPADVPLVGEWLGRAAGLFHVCLEVDDIHAAIGELKAKGVGLLTEEPMRGHADTLVAFIDPQATANVLFELVQAAAPVAGE